MKGGGRRSASVAFTLAVLLVVGGCTGGSHKAGPSGPAPGPTAALPLASVYASRHGVLHIRVKAEQLSSTISGRKYDNIYSFSTKVVDGKGTYTKGTASAYVGAQWQVQPGDRLIIDYVNALPNLTFTPVGSTASRSVPQPINLHTHGLTVSPSGNSDNVLLSVPQGRSNRYVIDIPRSQYHGLYWYHPHIHGLTDDQVYEGLAGHIVVGRADGDYRELNDLPVLPMMIRYNVSDPVDGHLVDASPYDTAGTALVPRGKMVYTVNGQVAPSIKLNAANPAAGTKAESQVWAFTNITGSATYVLALEEVDAAKATDPSVVGRPVDFTVVSVDGTPMPRPMVRSGEAAARGYLLGQGGRVAILVQGASDPSKVVRLVQLQNRSGTGEAGAYNWPAQKFIGGYRDYTRDVLAVGYSDLSHPGRHVDTPTALTPSYPVVNKIPDGEPVANRRTFVFDAVAKPTEQEPNNFPVNSGLFPNNRVDQPKAGTVEEWTILNYSGLHHPFHVHTQYGKVEQIVSPVDPAFRDGPNQYPSVQYVTDLSQPEPAPFNQDIVNIPPARVGADGQPVLGPDGVPVQPGKAVIRVKFEDFLGTYVEHCHRLPHEDRGMMSLVRTIANDPVVAVGRASPAGSTVSVLRSSDSTQIAQLEPFPGYTGPISTAVGDVDGDAVPDVAVASGRGQSTSVKIYSGASRYSQVLREIKPFGNSTLGATVALGDLNADGRDDVVVGQGPGAGPKVALFDGGTAARLAQFDAYAPDFSGGVSVAAGMVEEGGRISLVTGAGPGGPPTVKIFNFDLFGTGDGNMPDVRHHLHPLEVASFLGADAAHQGGVTVSTGYPFAAGGGFATIITSTSSGSGSLGFYRVISHDMEVSASGVVLAHDYQPDGPRHVQPVQSLSLASDPKLSDGATASALSTWTGAVLVIAPASGGAVRLWSLAASGQGFAPTSTLPIEGSATAAS